MKRMPFGLKLKVKFNFLRIILLIIILGFVLTSYLSIELLNKNDPLYAYYYSLVIQSSFTAIVIILLITIVFFLHRTVGPLDRIENELEKVINGNYSVRITVRKKDILYSLIEKINKVLEILSKKANK